MSLRGVVGPMLEALDDVPWGALGHAYGSAEDVPGLIRSIAFGDREAREAAWYKLYGNLWHQGTVYEASSRAVPFLLEIAAQSDAADLHEVIVYLACLARGSSYLDVHQHPSGLKTPDEKAQLTRELAWVRKVREEARKGLPLFIHLLDHHDPRVRSAACHMLACFPEDSSTIAAHLCRLFERGDADAGSRAACVLAIGEIGRGAATCPQQVRDALGDTEPPAVRAIATVTAALFERADASDALRADVGELAADFTSFEAVLDLFPWDAGNPEEYLLPALVAIGAGDGKPIELLVGALRHADPVMSQYYVDFLCGVAFQSEKAPGSPTPLTSHQNRALTAIAQSDVFWRWAAGSGLFMAAETLKGYDLPTTREALCAYLRRNAPSE
jgi:hypothetical protein